MSKIQKSRDGNYDHSTYKAALHETSIKETDCRKLKAAALGRKSACQITATKDGFSYNLVHLCAGQVISFRWDEQVGNGLNIVQTVHDGNTYTPVVGGFHSGKIERKGYYEQQFNLEGEYMFACGGQKCQPLNVVVDARRDIEAEVGDTGFKPRIIRIDEGNAVKWTWSECHTLHTVTEALYNHRTGKLEKFDSRSVPTRAGCYRQEFNIPGLFYFLTEGEDNKFFCCIVHVRERQREYKIEVFDDGFEPSIIVIEEGDRLWWEWKESKCEKTHFIYEIEPPRQKGDAYKHLKGGFKWTRPTKSGLLSYEFFECGVYYYSDQSLTESATYIGTIIVKPKVIDRFIELTRDGFQHELTRIGTNERLWWTWMPDEFGSDFRITEVTRCLAGPIDDSNQADNAPQKEGYMDEEIEKTKVVLGLESVLLSNVGVYHYRQTETDNQHDSTCSVIADHGSKNHTIHMTDKGPQPEIVYVNPGDRVWFVWQDGVNPHNVVQVAFSGDPQPGGFNSGAPTKSPSAYMREFTQPGINYFRSDTNKNKFGAVVVQQPPLVHDVRVGSRGEINPEIKKVRLNDAVAWIFNEKKRNDVQLVSSTQPSAITNGNPQSNQNDGSIANGDANGYGERPSDGDVVAARRCMNRAFNNPGVFHFGSRSFRPQAGVNDLSTNEPNDGVVSPRISTVIVDETDEHFTVAVDAKGFHPRNATVKQGDSVMWNWKNSGDELHNIVRVNPPTDSLDQVTPVVGRGEINSGKPVVRSSFLHPFDDLGTYTVKSAGAPGVLGTVTVVEPGMQTSAPYLEAERAGVPIDQSGPIKLVCDNPAADIYYSTEGCKPALHLANTKLYDKNRGVELTPDAAGMCVIRAIAVAPGLVPSDVFTSSRLLVVGDNRAKQEEKRWNEFTPSIRALRSEVPTEIGVVWDPPSNDVLDTLSGYQLFLNGVSYGPMLPPECTGAKVSGLAGGSNYDIWLEAYSQGDKFPARKSNVLTTTNPSVTPDGGGPVLSLETAANPDAMSLVWRQVPGAGSYQLYINGEKCGGQIVPEAGADRCRVVIESCSLHTEYKVLVAAVSSGGDQDKLSNELSVTLPLDVKNIVLPPQAQKTDINGQQVPVEDEVYKEYLQVQPTDSTGKPGGTHTAVIDVKDEPQSGSGIPMPRVKIEKTDESDVYLISWTFPHKPGPAYKRLKSAVNISGERFKSDINSNESFNCMVDVNGHAVPGTRQSWNVKLDNCKVRGLTPGVLYSAEVESTYQLTNGTTPSQVQVKSKPVVFTLERVLSAGARGVDNGRQPLQVKVDELDNCQVGVGWDPDPELDNTVAGYQLMVDGKPAGGLLPKSARHTSISKLQPGQHASVSLVAVASDGQPVDMSNSVKVACPVKPTPPVVKEQPSFQKRSVCIAWNKPAEVNGPSRNDGDKITYYRVFLNGKWYGDVKANPVSDRNGYQYSVSNLTPGQTYNITVKAISGQLKTDGTAAVNADGNSTITDIHGDNLHNGGSPAVDGVPVANGVSPDGTVYCPCESDSSANLTVTCSAPPTSPHLRIEDMNSDGVDVSWEMPQQIGDAALMGYQMLKDGKPYGAVIPPDVNNMRVKDFRLGDKAELQIMALTNHSSGHQSGQRDSDPYEGCTAGPKLVVNYSGLVDIPRNVTCDKVSGHSAVIRWNRDRNPREHFVMPDSYQVTWWPGEKPVSDIRSESTTGDHLQLTGLRPNAVYTVVVEARKMCKYSEVNEGSTPNDGGSSRTFIMTSKSEQLTLQTASPPEPPSNLGIGGTTCNSVKVYWDTPRQRGAEVIGIRVDAVPLNKSAGDPANTVSHLSLELPADAKSAVLEGLDEKTEYSISVSALTAEYFEQLPDGHELKRHGSLPRHCPPPRNGWLPTSTIITMTSGTDPPTDVKIVRELPDSIRLAWTPARVYGSNRLQGTVVRWSENRTSTATEVSGEEMASHKTVQADCNGVVVDGLEPGVSYRFVVEAVVSVKMNVDSDQIPLTTDDVRIDPLAAAAENEAANRRTTHVMSKAVVGRTRAPCEPPRPIVTGYTSTTIQLYWEKPLLEIMTNPRTGESEPRHVKLSLEGYRLEINGKPHMRLSPGTQQCTLIKCRPGKTYNVGLVAITCPEDVKRTRRRKVSREEDADAVKCEEWQPMPEDVDNDESLSLPITVILPTTDNGAFAEKSAHYVWPSSSTTDKDDIGHVRVKWSLQDSVGSTSGENGGGEEKPVIRQYNVTWTNTTDNTTREMFLEPHVTHCSVPVTKRKAVYDVTIKPQFDRPPKGAAQPVQRVQCLVPGSPDPPKIWTRRRRANDDTIGDDEAIVEWSEPHLYGVKVNGYQIYVNGKKTGSPLTSKHRRAIIPLRGKRVYRVSVKALPSDSRVAESEQSNVLTLNEPLVDLGGNQGLIGGGQLAALLGDDSDIGDGLPVNVVRLTDAAIHLNWSQYQAPVSIVYYRVVWSSASNPSVREVRLPAREQSCVIHKCYPGTYHYVRVYAVGSDDVLLGRSRRLTVQTSAPPEPPSVSVRAVNFKYITIEWVKPAVYGDAVISGYKVYVNGIVEATLHADELSFNLTSGVPCKDYIFQVQTVSVIDKYVSRLSDPVVVTWPGMMAPILQSTPQASGTVRLYWQPPFTTKGVTIKRNLVVVVDALTKQKVQTLVVNNDATQVDVVDLRTGSSYMASLQVHVNESAEAVESEWHQFQCIVCADPPHITVNVVGLDERRQLEYEICNVINKRDRLLSLAAKDPGSFSDMLSQTESLLDENLDTMTRQFTGFLLAHVSWSSRQSNADIQITGYQVMVNGKKYGSILHSGLNSLRIKVGVSKESHKISLLAVYELVSEVATTSRQLTVESNVVELTTNQFRPFAFYLFLNQLPRAGSVNFTKEAYAETLMIERRRVVGAINGNRVPVNEGLLAAKLPVPCCAVMDAVTGEYRPLSTPASSGGHTALHGRPTVMLFWSSRCMASQKYLTWFVRFARSHVTQCECLAVTCSESRSLGVTDRQELISFIVDNGWRDDACLKHLTSQALAKADSNSTQLHGGDLCNLLGVNGVPSVVVIHPNGYVAWRGRYCAFEYSSFEHFMLYVMAQVMGQPVPNPDPWDPDLNVLMREALKRRAASVGADLLSSTSMTFGTNTMSINGARSGNRHQSQSRLTSTSRSSKTRKEPLTINARPFSASWSPYEEKLAHTTPPLQRRKAGRKTKSIF